MDPEVEARLAPMLAEAAQRLLQTNQAQVQQQQAQQQAQDPIIQMQQQELAIKQAEQQRKAAKDAADIELRKSQQRIEAARIMSQNETSMKQATLRARVDLATDCLQRKHDKTLQNKEIMSDALKTIFQSKNKPTKGE